MDMQAVHKQIKLSFEKKFVVVFTEVDCGTPQRVTNATVAVNGTTFEDTANYTCEVGFKFPSGASLVVTSCNDTGKWTAANETCQG